MRSLRRFVDFVAGHLIALRFLGVFEIGDEDAAGVAEDVGDDEDAAGVEDFVGRGRQRRVRPLGDQPRADASGVFVGDGRAAGRGNQHVAVGFEHGVERDVLAAGKVL